MATNPSLVKNIINILKRNFLLILIPSIIIGGIYAYYTKKIPATYTSYSKIFPLTAEANSDPTSGLKAAFGLADGGSSLSKYYNVNELVKSRNLSRKIVQFASKNPKNPKLYEWIIADYNNALPIFGKKIKLDKDSIENINTAADIFVGNTNIKVEKSDFTAINVSSSDPNLSLRLNECILTCISDFYIESKTAKARLDVTKIGLLRDSLRSVMDVLMYKQASTSDQTMFAVKSIAGLPQAKLERMRSEVEEAYGVSLTAYTNANFKLLSESPIFQILDKPVNPTDFIKPSWKKAFAIGFILSFILLSIITLSKIIYKLIQEEIDKL